MVFINKWTLVCVNNLEISLNIKLDILTYNYLKKTIFLFFIISGKKINEKDYLFLIKIHKDVKNIKIILCWSRFHPNHVTTKHIFLIKI